ncbi:MAG TPA: geranylgeranyl reductase family protein [Actinomycetota bacterium]|nr:geranylgeranyl reductase family protein [Actinomycetota bacterium]
MTYDVVVVGGGPAGSSAAWRAATAGARVLLCDKAQFPRDKPCGDGLTPRAVASIESLGLENELKRFNRVEKLRVNGAGRTLTFDWPKSDSFPDFGYVIARTDLDEMLLRHAEAAGAEVREGVSVVEPVVENGVVRGVVAKRNGTTEQVRADIVVAADGASSRVARALGMQMSSKRPIGLAVRAHFEARRPASDDEVIESFLELRDGDKLLPGYGWIFPMGRGSSSSQTGRINVGVGILSSYKGWREVNTAHLMEVFMRSLPDSWELPDITDLRATGQLKGWRLPMGLGVWPPWRPGAIACGDAAGVVNPFNGEGISEAVESGVVGMEVALDALGGRGPSDLSAYGERLDELWGSYYRLGRTFVRLIGRPRIMRSLTSVGMRVPPVMEFAFKLLANLYHERGGTAGDHLVRAMLRLASVIKVG